MRRRAILLLATIAAALVMVSGAALAEVTRTTTTVRPFTLDNPCTDEVDPITFSGTATFLRHFVQDESPEPGEPGGTHFITRIFADDIVGTDASGQEYRLEEVRSFIPNQNNPVGPGFVRTLTTNYRVFSSEGGAPEFLGHSTVHLTINANGETVVEFTDTITKCPGA